MLDGSALDGAENELAVEVVLLALGQASTVEEAVDCTLATAGPDSGVPLTVILVGAAAANLAALQRTFPTVRFVSGAQVSDPAQAWGLGVQLVESPWLVLMSDDVRPDTGWLDRLAEYARRHADCNAVSPTVRSGKKSGTTAAPASGRGVCLFVSREALLQGQVRSIDRALAASVTVVRAPAETALPVHGGDEPATAGSAPDAAPGGGAPPGEIVWLGNLVHAGAERADMRRRIHLGCGKNRIRGWLNIDGDASGRPDLVADLRIGIPLEDNSVDRIYSEHFFEHCTLEQGMVLFAECLRVLTPGGVMRTAMPNLREAVMYYLDGWRNQDWLRDFPHIDSAARMLNVSLREWGHQYVYDHDELALRLRQVGFCDIQAPGLGESSHADLRNLESRPESTLIIEASKPAVGS